MPFRGLKGHLSQAYWASFQSQWGINGISETRISLQSAASGRGDEWKSWQAGELLFIMAGTSLPSKTAAGLRIQLIRC